MTVTGRAAQSELSRQRILDATIEIAAERGYEGTTMARVSSRAGLPVTSVYWHFNNKDELLAAVIVRCVERIRAESTAVVGDDPHATVPGAVAALRRLAEVAIAGSSEFLRLGLMLVLERRPVEATAREVYIDYRREGYEGIVALLESSLADVPAARRTEAAGRIAQFFQSLFDGLFISHEIEQDSGESLARRLDLAGVALAAVVERVRADAISGEGSR